MGGHLPFGTGYASTGGMDFIEKWKAERERAAFIALDDGAVFHGVAFGAPKDALGEVVFNTGMSGYQEILTDPSYAGQFVVLTTAEVGNYGVNSADAESRGLFLSGLVVGDLTEPSSWRSEMGLGEYLRGHGIPGIYGVDTRALTLHIREHGNRKAFLKVAGAGPDVDNAIAKAREWPGLDGQDYAARVTCEKPYCLPRAAGGNRMQSTASWKGKPHVVCYDFGVKANILRSLAPWADVTVVPAKTTAGEVLALNPDGVFLSNGPADPSALTYAIENIRKLLGITPFPTGLTGFTRSEAGDCPDNLVSPAKALVPIMGICLGHQLLALACGARTARLKFGHHGCNHPVKNLLTGKVEITSQNHNFAVVAESLPECLEVTHANLNDGTIEGLRHRTLPVFSVQYHPESCPGPHDSGCVFDAFRQAVERRTGNRR